MTITKTVVMPYIGYVLSVNHCCYGGGYGKRLRREVRAWMDDLAELIHQQIPRKFRLKPVTVELRGLFRNRRATPDLHNLHKIIGDAVAEGLEMNDVDFRFEDKGYDLDKSAQPRLIMTIIMGR